MVCDFRRSSYRSHPVIAVCGELDFFSGSELSDALAESRKLGHGTIIDLSRATYLSSTPIGVMLACSQDRESVAVVCPDGEVRRVLDRLGVSPALRVAPSLEAAALLLDARRKRGLSKEA